MTYFIQILTAFFGAMGFAFIYNCRGASPWVAAFGGGFSWAIYLWSHYAFQNKIIALFIAAMTVSVLSEIFARIIKTPVTILLVPMLIPLIPGSDLYLTTVSLVQNHMSQCIANLRFVLQEAAAIAVGVIFVAGLTQIVLKIIFYIKAQNAIKHAKK